jgi:F-type H+-transporting ATPase subunit b
MTHALGRNIVIASWALGGAVWLLAAAPARAAQDQAETGQPYGDLGQALMILFVFAGLLLILGKYAWKPIIGQLQRREKDIAERIQDTERRNREAKELEAHYKASLDRAEAEAKQILARNLEEVARAREDLLAAARQEGNRTIEAAKAEIEMFKKAAIEELQQATAGMAVSIAGEILQRQLTPEMQEKLVEQSLTRIRASTEREGG